MKKKIAVLLCVMMLFAVLTVAVSAEGEGGDKVWDLWSLLSISNVNYLSILGTLLTSLITIFKMISGADGIKSFFTWLGNMLKNLIPSGK